MGALKSIFKQEECNVNRINNYIKDERLAEVNSNKNVISTCNPKNPQKIYTKQSPNMTFLLSFIVKSFCCNRKTAKDKKKLQVYSNLKDFYIKRMDMIYYLRTLNAIEVTNSMLFNPNQKKLLEYPFKPNIFSIEDLHAFGMNKQEEASFPKSEITDYFAARIEKRKLDKYDRKIFKVLPKALLGEIDIEQ